MAKALWKLHFSAGRSGTLHGMFVATDEEIEAAMGQHLEFGEVLGKHSDVAGPLEASDITRVTDDQEFITKFEEYECSSGYNPLDALPENEEEEDEEESEEEAS